MSAEPALSIGLPVYNGANFIRELLQNLEEQTFGDFELIISDNASTDETRDICLEFAKKDLRIRYHRHAKNVGALRNYNCVFRLARAPMFKWAAHDDLYHPTYLEKCVDALNANPDAVGAHAGTRYIDPQGRPFLFSKQTGLHHDPVTGRGYQLADKEMRGDARLAVVRFARVLWGFHRSWSRRSYCHCIFGVFRSSALRQTRLLNARLYEADKVLLLESVSLGRFVEIPQKLYFKRYHDGMSAILDRRARQAWADPCTRGYFPKLRLFTAYLSAPLGKPIPPVEKLLCMTSVCALGLKYLPLTALRALGLLRDADTERIAALGTAARPPSPLNGIISEQ